MICRRCAMIRCRCKDLIVIGGQTPVDPDEHEEAQRQGLFNMITILGFGLTILTYLDHRKR